MRKILIFIGIFVVCGVWGFIAQFLFGMPMLTGIGAVIIGAIGFGLMSDKKHDDDK